MGRLQVSGALRSIYGSLGVKRLMLLWAALCYVTGNGASSNISSGSNWIIILQIYFRGKNCILHTLLVFEPQTPIMQSNHSAGITHKVPKHFLCQGPSTSTI